MKNRGAARTVKRATEPPAPRRGPTALFWRCEHIRQLTTRRRERCNTVNGIDVKLCRTCGNPKP